MSAAPKGSTAIPAHNNKGYLSEVSTSKVRILYLYNYKGWAIHNVGKLWLNDIPNLKVTFKDSEEFKKSDFYQYDLVWFGYLDIFLDHYSRFCIDSHNLNKCIVAVHDPLELFPQQEDWKNINLGLSKWWSVSSWYRWSRLRILSRVRHTVTISKEMHSILLEKYGIESFLIPTTSSLTFKDKSELRTEKCDILSVFEIYPRKNIPLMETIQRYCKEHLKLKFDTKVGKKILPVDKYTKLIDEHELYICTSYQEGGPLPAMDAMQRGSVVLSTPVGQIQDIIKNGQNGYICKTKNEFIDKITLLSNDLKLLHKMRIKSLESIHSDRNAKEIKSSTSSVINNVLLFNGHTSDNKRKDVLNYFMWVCQNNLYKLLCLGFTLSKVSATYRR
jgi:hypothetical protein